MVGAELDNIVIYILESKLCDIQLFLCNQRLTKKLKIITVALIEQITCLSIYKINPVRSHRSNAKKETVVHLFNRSKDHGSGCATVLNIIHCSLYHVYCLTQSTSICSDNTQILHRSTVEGIPKQCPHPRPKVNVLATQRTLCS